GGGTCIARTLACPVRPRLPTGRPVDGSGIARIPTRTRRSALAPEPTLSIAASSFALLGLVASVAQERDWGISRFADQSTAASSQAVYREVAKSWMEVTHAVYRCALPGSDAGGFECARLGRLRVDVRSGWIGGWKRVRDDDLRAGQGDVLHP